MYVIGNDSIGVDFVYYIEQNELTVYSDFGGIPGVYPDFSSSLIT